MSETGPMRAAQRIANVIAAEFKDWVAAGCPAVEEPDNWRDEVRRLVMSMLYGDSRDRINGTMTALDILADRIERLEQGP